MPLFQKNRTPFTKKVLDDQNEYLQGAMDIIWEEIFKMYIQAVRILVKMREISFFIMFGCGICGWFMGCGQQSLKAVNAVTNPAYLFALNDSTSIMQFFETLKYDKKFLKDLGLEKEIQSNWNDQRMMLIRGDLDGDEISDVVAGFCVEGRGVGKNYDWHYAFLLDKGSQWSYCNQLDASIFVQDRFLCIEKTENGVIKAHGVGLKDQNLSPIAAKYIFKGGQLQNGREGMPDEGNVSKKIAITGGPVPDNQRRLDIEKKGKLLCFLLPEIKGATIPDNQAPPSMIAEHTWVSGFVFFAVSSGF